MPSNDILGGRDAHCRCHGVGIERQVQDHEGSVHTAVCWQHGKNNKKDPLEKNPSAFMNDE